MVIVDSTVLIDHLRGTLNPHTVWLERNGGLREIGITDLILHEVLQGAKSDLEFERTRQRLSEFETFNTGGESLAVESARHYRLLRARGLTVRKLVDCLIATFCVSAGHALLHRDRDFDPFEAHLGLKVIHPLSQ
jgi:predicted nucleic acid-binding protein